MPVQLVLSMLVPGMAVLAGASAAPGWIRVAAGVIGGMAGGGLAFFNRTAAKKE
jgi:hypothetical protein